MIAVAAAKTIIRENVIPLLQITIPLPQAVGMCLATDVYATMAIPAFAQSSMDGYAFAFKDWLGEHALQINGEVPAGSGELNYLLPGQAMRIFTGAAVPVGADTVVMQEKVTVKDGLLNIEDNNLQAGSNVRLAGSEINTGELALAAGSILQPAAIGFLTGIGITHVNVYAKPAITLIVTGKELQQPGQPLQHGQVYESNSYTLTAALQQLAINDVKILWADDDLEILKSVLQTALQQSDVVLLTGGISVGDYDFVLEAATQCGVQQLFHRIKQRPGKPLYFGKKEAQFVFGLPGNPSSVLTCFYEYVMPALQLLSKTINPVRTKLVPLGISLNKPAGLTHFLKGYYNGENVVPLDAQESYRLSSFARANCLLQIDEAVSQLKAGENVEIHLLP